MSDLPILIAIAIAIAIAIFGIVTGALGAYLLRFRTRPQPPGQQPDSGLAGLAEATASLDGRVSSVHALVTDLLREQTTAGERLASTAEQTAALHMVLASPKRRGDWGEVLAEDVLRCAGLQDGINFARQRTLPNGARPDFTFFMPSERELYLDSKFPLENYRRMETADTDDAREAARKAFVGDIKRHIKALADRGYADPASTVGFCILFIANPAIFAAAVEADPDIIKHALERHIVLADASTFMAVLMLAKSAADAFRVQRRTVDVLRCLTEFRGEWERLTTHIDRTDKQLATFLKSWEGLTGTRRRQLQRRLDRIDELDIGDEPAEVAPDTPTALPESHPQAA